MVYVDNLDRSGKLKQKLNTHFNYRTYPKVVINLKMIGGNSDLTALIRSGKFGELMEKTD